MRASFSTRICKRAFHCSPVSLNDTTGFIGLGNMGKGMATNLVTKGHSVTVFDVVGESVKSLESVGATASEGIHDVGSKSSKIVTMLPNNSAVEKVYSQLFETISPGSFLIDSSTVDPALSKQVHQEAVSKGCMFVDAPVSGGINAAAAGTLTFMVGAETEEDFKTAKAMLDLMGSKVTHCGGVGTGGAVKICNNMLLAVSMIGTAEAMNLGVELGLDPKLLASILGSATGRCWSVDTYNPVPGVLPNVPSSNDYKGGFGTSLMTKDLGLAQDAATRTGAPTPLGSLAHQVYRVMCKSGYAEKDFSSAYRFLQEK